jgi:hypothetical protein
MKRYGMEFEYLQMARVAIARYRVWFPMNSERL